MCPRRRCSRPRSRRGRAKSTEGRGSRRESQCNFTAGLSQPHFYGFAPPSSAPPAALLVAPLLYAEVLVDPSSLKASPSRRTNISKQ